MQTQHGSLAEEAILSAERTFRARVKIDWYQDGGYAHKLSDVGHYVEVIKTDRSLRGSAPEEVLLIEGASSAELTATLHGEYLLQPLSHIFSPYNKRSPLYGNPMVGAEITYELGVETVYGIFWYPQFIGNVRTITPNRADNTVVITALDRAEVLRRPIDFAPWALSEYHCNVRESLVSQLTNSSWVIDHCLRQCETSPTPYRPTFQHDFNDLDFSNDGSMVWVNGTGSFLPSVGWVARPSETRFPKIDGTELVMHEHEGAPHPDSPEPSSRPFNQTSLGDDDGDFEYWSHDRDVIEEEGLHLVSFTAILRGQNGDHFETADEQLLARVYIGGLAYIDVLVSDGEIYSEAGRCTERGNPTGEKLASFGAVLPDSDFCRVNVVWDTTIETGTRAYVSAGTNESGIVDLADGSWWDGDIPNHSLKGMVKLYTPVGLNDFTYSVRAPGTDLTVGINAGVPARYAAVLDEGLQELSHIPVRKGDDAWQIITDVAAAEFGSVFWDEAGVFHFWNYERMVGLQSEIVRTYTLDDLSDLEITNTFDSVRNIWSIEANRAVSISGVVYDSGSADEFYMPEDGLENQTKKYRVWSDDIVAPNPVSLRKCTENPDFSTLQLWDDTVTHGYVVTFLDGTIEYEDEDGEAVVVERWEEDPGLHSEIDIRTFYDGGGQLVLQVFNNSGKPCRFATTTVAYTTETVTDPETGDVISETRVEDPTKSVEPKAALRVGGNIISRSPSHVTELEDRSSVRAYGGQNLTVSGDWVQDGFNESKIRSILMPRMLKPAPTTDQIVLAGDPRLQVGDTIEITDRDGFGQGIKLQTYGISREFSLDGGLTDSLTVEMIQPVPLDTDPDEPQLPEITRYNLCPNPALQNDAEGWFGPEGAGRISVSEMPAVDGFFTGQTGGAALPQGVVTEELVYRFSAYVKASAGATTGSTGIDWYDNEGYISSSASVGFALASGQTLRVDTGAAEAPLTAVAGVMAVNADDAPVQITAVLYEQTALLRDWFDGNTEPTGVWDGVEGNSTSRILAEGDAPDPGTDMTRAADRYGWGAKDPQSDRFTYIGPPNPAKWEVYDGPGHDGNGIRSPDQVVVNGSFLRITGLANGTTGGLAHKFDQKYGRWEVRARFRAEPGAIGFPYHGVLITWTDLLPWPDGGEYDFVEIDIGDTGLTAFLHYPGHVPIVQEEAHLAGIDLTEWHNYGFEWTNGTLVGYCDGVEWFRFSGLVSQGPTAMHLTCQLDNFDYDDEGLQQAYMDIEEANAYPLRDPVFPSGPADGSMNPPS